MTDSLGRRLLRRIRLSAVNATPVPTSRGKPPEAADIAAARDALTQGGVTAAERLLELVVSADRCGGELQAVAIDALTTSSPQAWLALDLVSRRSWWAFPAWWRDAVDQAAKGDSVLGVVVASFHPDGHVREAATARLSEAEHVLVDPSIALRCADWVGQVRDRARLAFERRLDIALLPTLESAGTIALLVARRHSGSWLAATIGDRLQAATTNELRTLARSSQPLLRRAAVGVAVAQQRFALDELVDFAVQETDLPARLTCGVAAIEIARSSGQLGTIAPLLRSPATRLRQTVMIAFDQAGDSGAAIAGLADRAGSVRETAQRLVRANDTEPADVYRDALNDQPPAIWAIAGIGETGSAADVPLAERFLDESRSRARAEAVRALRRLKAATPQRLTPLLSDPSPGVCKQVGRALEPIAGELDPGRLRALLGAAEQRHTREAAYRLLRARDPWTRLGTNLELLDDELEALRTRARVDILGWLAHEAASTYRPPAPEEAAELGRAIDARTNVLGRSTAEALRFHIGLPSAE